MKLSEYLDGMQKATTADELEAAIQQPYTHAFHGAIWTRISNVRIEAGYRIVDASPLARFVPRLGPRRLLRLCDRTYGVGYGQNGAGERWVWAGAEGWMIDLLKREGFTARAAHRIANGQWSTYPHRLLATVTDALAGRINDPPLNELLPYLGVAPIKYTVEQNNGDDGDRRATRPCRCGGTLFDWGAGSSDGFDYISWHCNACPWVFTEYLSAGQLSVIRSRAWESLVNG